MSNSIKKSITVGSIILAAVVSFIPLVKTSFDTLIDFELFPKQLAFGFLAILIIVMFYKSKIDKPLLNGAVIGFLIFVLGNIVSLTAAINSAEAWGTIAKNVIYASLLVGLILGFYTKKLDINTISKGAIGFGLIVGLSGLNDIIEAFKSNDVMNSIYAIKTLYVHKNFMASGLLMAMPLVIYQVIKNEKIFGITAKVALILMTVDIALLRTRSVWLALLLSVLFVFAVFFIFSKEKKSSVKWLKFLGVGTGAFVVLTIALFQFTNISESVFNKASLDKRYHYWNSSIEMIAEQPITGIGAGNWRINFPKHGLMGVDATTLEGSTTINRPHNDLLWIFSETGIIGLTGFLCFLIFTIWFGIKVFTKSESQEEKQFTLLSLFGMVSFMVYGFFEFPLERPEHYFFFILYAAWIIAAYLKYHNPKGLKVSTIPVVWTLLILSIFSTYVVSQRLSGAISAKKTLQFYGTNNFKGLVLNGEKAINFCYNMDAFGNPLNYFVGIGKYGQGNIKAARINFDQSLKNHPYHILTYIQMGNTYKNEKKFDLALGYYQQLIDFVGINQTAILNIAEVNYYKKDYKASLLALNRVKIDESNQKFMGLTAECLAIVYNNPNISGFNYLLPKDGQVHDKQYLLNHYLIVRKARDKQRYKNNIEPKKN